MRKTVLLFFFCWVSFLSFAQNCNSERYLSNVFQSSVSQDITYGNSPALTAVYVAENVTVDQEMTMDIFFPVGDNLPKRPLVMLAYGGGYLFGTKEDEDVWATCDSLAKKGYVTASINYRMNLNVVSEASAIRAMYRAAQDYSSALRFIKEKSDVYGVDTNYIFIGGVSAGGFSAMHMAFVDDNERPAATFQSGILGANPDLGCIDCAGNNYHHSNNVRGIINLWGALLDTSFIQANEVVPMTLFHGTDDLIVPYDDGLPFTALFTMPQVNGSANIAARVANLGGNPELNLFQGVGHNIWGLNVNNVMVGGPTEHWSPITDSIISFLYENIRPENADLNIPSIVCQDDTILLQINNLPVDGRACWSVENGVIVSASIDSSTLSVVWQSTGTFEVSVTVFNHLEAASIPSILSVQVNPNPIVNISNNNGQLEASGSYPLYQWFLNGMPLQGETQSVLSSFSTGSYTVEAFGSNGCSSISDALITVGIAELATKVERASSVRLIDVLGRTVAEYSVEQWKALDNPNPSFPIIVEYFNMEGITIFREKRMVSSF